MPITIFKQQNIVMEEMIMQMDVILVAVMAVLMILAGVWGWWSEHHSPEDKEYQKKQLEKDNK